jgi:drug/metabolite transporter (DMT)-like permease
MSLPRLPKAELELLAVSAIWGLGFVAQQAGARAVGTFPFNAARFLLGALILLPLLLRGPSRRSSAMLPGILCGGALFSATSLQTFGIVSTGTGKAAFITCLYLVLVPIGSRFLGEKVGGCVWAGCLLALVGLFFLCLKGAASCPTRGDLLVLASAFFWSLQILLAGRFSARHGGVRLAFWQFLSCSLLSLAAAPFAGTHASSGLEAALLPVLYSGLFTVGVAFTLQMTGQAGTTPSRAAIFLSLETVFAAIAGAVILGERLGSRELLGCALMLSGTILSQLGRKRKDADPDVPPASKQG